MLVVSGGPGGCGRGTGVPPWGGRRWVRPPAPPLAAIDTVTVPDTVAPLAGAVIATLSPPTNDAVTDVDAESVTEHVPVLLQAPLHPPNAEPAAGAAISVTAVPGAYDSVQSLPQAMPAGLLVTVPLPMRWTVSVGAGYAKVTSARSSS